MLFVINSMTSTKCSMCLANYRFLLNWIDHFVRTVTSFTMFKFHNAIFLFQLHPFLI